MASSPAVSAALKMLARVFAGEVTAEKVAMYAAALEDLSDEQVAASVTILVRGHEGHFLPVPAEIRKACGENRRLIPDAEGALYAIERLGCYVPSSGWVWPGVQEVRESLGDVIADAYAAAGGAYRLSAQNETSRMIAVRDFAQELRANADDQPLLPPAVRVARLPGPRRLDEPEPLQRLPGPPEA